MAGIKLRVLTVDLAKRHGGVDVRVVDTAKGLKNTCEVLAVVLEGSPVAELLIQAGVAIYPIIRKRHDPRIIVDIARAARNFRADVIDTHNPQSQLWGALAGKLAGVKKIVASVHTIYRVAHRGRLRRRSHEAVLILNRILNVEFIAVSNSIRSYLIELGVAPNRITLSYNGVATASEEPEGESLREVLGVPETQLLVGMIGRVQKVKGYDILVSALAKLKQRHHLVQAVIIGEGTDEEDLHRMIKEADLGSHVHCLGHRKDATSLMPHIDVLCMPSRSEGLPYTALEAARSNLAIVASAVDGLQEVFSDRDNAILTPPGDVDAFANALEELSSDVELRTRLGRAAGNLIAAKFTVERMVAETLAVYSLRSSSVGEGKGDTNSGARSEKFHSLS